MAVCGGPHSHVNAAVFGRLFGAIRGWRPGNLENAASAAQHVRLPLFAAMNASSQWRVASTVQSDTACSVAGCDCRNAAGGGAPSGSRVKQTQGSVSPAAVKRRRTDGGHSQPRPRVLLIEPFYGGSHQQLADLLHKHITSTLEWPVQLLTLRDKKVCGQRPARGAARSQWRSLR